MKKNQIGINWFLKYRLEKNRAELLETKINLLQRKLAKYENHNTRSTRNRKDNNVIEFSRSVHPTRD